MEQLPSAVTALLSEDNNRMKVAVRVKADGNAVFVWVNQRFIDFHKNLSIVITEEGLLGMEIRDYFRVYLGFTEDQINQRMLAYNRARETNLPTTFREVSDHPGIPVMILESIWKPVIHARTQYIIWESQVYTQTKL